MSENADTTGASLDDAIRAWFAEYTEGESVLTSWIVVAEGAGFGDDGERQHQMATAWDASMVTRLGLAEAAANRFRSGFVLRREDDL